MSPQPNAVAPRAKRDSYMCPVVSRQPPVTGYPVSESPVLCFCSFCGRRPPMASVMWTTRCGTRGGSGRRSLPSHTPQMCVWGLRYTPSVPTSRQYFSVPISSHDHRLAISACSGATPRHRRMCPGDRMCNPIPERIGKERAEYGQAVDMNVDGGRSNRLEK